MLGMVPGPGKLHPESISVLLTMGYNMQL
jgi:hypothetical protein